MSYALLQKENGLPSAVNTNSYKYVELMLAGYEVTETGSRRDMQDMEKELLEQLDTPTLEFRNNRYLIN